MSMIGADVFAVRDFVRRLLGRVDQIEEAKNRMTTVVHSVPWVGEDRERFLREWNEIHQPNLVRLIGDLRVVATDATNAADQQDRASQA